MLEGIEPRRSPLNQDSRRGAEIPRADSSLDVYALAKKLSVGRGGVFPTAGASLTWLTCLTCLDRELGAIRRPAAVVRQRLARVKRKPRSKSRSHHTSRVGCCLAAHQN